MGESSFYCHPSPEGCCLELHETIVILVALIVLVQLALKLATVTCYYLCYLLGSLFGMVFAKAPEQAKAATPRPRSAQSRRPSERWSQEDVPRRHRRSESSSPRRRCLHCTLEPLRVTMDLQQQQQQPDSCSFREHRRTGRRSHPDYPPCPPRYYHCDCEWRPRPRPASAPSGYGVTRYRDVGVGNSDTLLAESAAADRRIGTPLLNTPLGTPMAPMGTPLGTPMAPMGSPLASDPFPRTPVADTYYRPGVSGQEADFPQAVPTPTAASTPRSRRPAKVYIYPVHPQTPPGSRSASPERSYRRRTPGQEELPEFEPRETRRKAREAELGMSAPPRFHTAATPAGKSMPREAELGMSAPARFHTLGTPAGQSTPLPADPKQRLFWNEQPSVQDWVYRPLK
ncbi:hypothetical protein lerEdw1_006345 [Lerista edwardsae]|nr:hypothetical protein lerEdw1_006345 [Lerista edwardsae]